MTRKFLWIRDCREKDADLIQQGQVAERADVSERNYKDIMTQTQSTIYDGVISRRS